MLCGTFPPKRDKWSMDFFYPNFYNDMWRIFGLIFYNNAEKFFDRKTKTIDKESIKQMLTEFKVGIGETVVEAIRQKDNASDKYLEIVTPVNLSLLLSKIPKCEGVVTTGEKAATIISSLTDTPLPRMGEFVDCEMEVDGSLRHFSHWRMPSTSRAYPMRLEKKTEYYTKMFRAYAII